MPPLYLHTTSNQLLVGTWQYVTCDHSALLHTSVVYNMSLIALRVLFLLSLQSSDVSGAGHQSMHWLIGECSGIQTSRWIA